MKDFFSGPQGSLLKAVSAKLFEHNFTAFLAGGCVRDYVMGRDWNDLDLATNATPDQIEELFVGSLKTLNIGKKFGVIVVVGEGAQIEVATFRKDQGYQDGRHPEAVTFSAPEEDAKRRDFTINSLFWDLKESKLIDFVQGQKDIDSKIIRCVGGAKERFVEDHLRMLRALRFASVLGFEIETETWQAILELKDKIKGISVERIREELGKSFAGNPVLTLSLLRTSEFYSLLFPELEVPGDWFFVDLPFSEDHHLKWMTPLLIVGAQKFIKDSVQIDDKGGFKFTETYLKFISDWCEKWKLSKQDERNLRIMVATPAVVEIWENLRVGVRRDLIYETSTSLFVIVLKQWPGFVSFRDEVDSYQNLGKPESLLSGKDLMSLPANAIRGELLKEAWYLQLEGLIVDRNLGLEWLKAKASGKKEPRLSAEPGRGVFIKPDNKTVQIDPQTLSEKSDNQSSLSRVESFETAFTSRRIVAHVLDRFFTMILYLPLILRLLGLYFQGEALVITWPWIATVLSMHFAFELIFIYWIGGLPFQTILGLTVVNLDGGEPTFIQCILRVIMDRLSFFASLSYYSVGLLNSERRHLGEIVSETRVVQLILASHSDPSRSPRPVHVYSKFAWILVLAGLVWGISENARQWSEWSKYCKITSSGLDFEDSVEGLSDIQFSLPRRGK